MVSRFVVADNDVIEELKTSSENLNTRKSTNLWVGVFKKWPALRNIGEDMETYTRFKNLTSSQLIYTNKFCPLCNRIVPRTYICNNRTI
jgi:hypothetical protein